MFKTVSLPGRERKLGLDESGCLWLKADTHGFQPVCFNEQYNHYYPQCCFTDIAATEKDFAAAAVDENGRPLFFRSLLGGVWERVEISCREGAPTGRIIRILAQSRPGEIFLCCENGEVVTIPDCSRCMTLRQVTQQKVKDAELRGDGIILTLQNDEILQVPLYKLSQMQVHPAYAKEVLAKGAVLIDLGCELESPYLQSWAKALLSYAVRVEPEKLEDWLSGQRKDGKMIFLCNYGVQAQRAAGMARGCGYTQAYFLRGACLPI